VGGFTKAKLPPVSFFTGLCLNWHLFGLYNTAGPCASCHFRSSALPLEIPLAKIVVGYGDTMSVVMRGCRQYFDEALIRRLIENWIAGCEAICTYP